MRELLPLQNRRIGRIFDYESEYPNFRLIYRSTTDPPFELAPRPTRISPLPWYLASGIDPLTIPVDRECYTWQDGYGKSNAYIDPSHEWRMAWRS
jgi:hypothetical protein